MFGGATGGERERERERERGKRGDFEFGGVVRVREEGGCIG